MTRLPPWLRTPLKTDAAFRDVHILLAEQALHTVCRSAQCPNIRECWNRRTATFMILGDRCTRACRFCAVGKGPEGLPSLDEPERVATAAARMNLRHVVITSVTRDDLPDGGAEHFAETIRAVRRRLPAASVEVLVPDFQGRAEAVGMVLAARPDVFGHNIETVERLQSAIRPQASYSRSLDVLKMAAESAAGALVKSGLMLGLGETDDEVESTLRDLYDAGCRVVTLGQYLAPSRAHVPVARFVSPEEFEEWRRRAERIGFAAVAAGPLVRSSYRAAELLAEYRAARGIAWPGC